MKSIALYLIFFLCVCAPGAQAGKISPGLEAKLVDAASDEPISVIVYMEEQAPVTELKASLKAAKASRQIIHGEILRSLQHTAWNQDELLAALGSEKAAGRVEGFTSYWISNLVVVYAVPSVIEELANRDDVGWIEPNFSPQLIDAVDFKPATVGDSATLSAQGIGVAQGLIDIGAQEVWRQYGFNGDGRIVASCDTGVEGEHPALKSGWRGNNGHPWQECWLDVLGNGSTYPVTVSLSNYHGSHTTGTMVGAAPDDTVGVAWGAQWIATNVINQVVHPATFDNDMIESYQWFADPDGNPSTVDDVPDVICNSWGVGEAFNNYYDCDKRFNSVIDNCEALGIVTVFSAGNSGPDPSTINSPADRAASITSNFSVGATDNYGTVWPYPIADFSSRGPSTCPKTGDVLIKPEISAPGVLVYSCITLVPDGIYGWGSGTSMAAPHIAGVVALMRQANHDIDVETVKNILMLTARDAGIPGDDNDYGRGFVDALAAVEMAIAGFGQITGSVQNSSFGSTPMTGVTLQLAGSSYEFSSNGDGNFSGYAPPGTYTLHVESPGFAPHDQFVTLVAGQTIDFVVDMIDVEGPAITDVSEPITSTDTSGPHVIFTDLFDHSTITSARIFHRVNGGEWLDSPMVESAEGYTGYIPGYPVDSMINYYIQAEDGADHVSVYPDAAPLDFVRLYVTQDVYSYDAEDPGDPLWQLGTPGDTAFSGQWVREKPVGTIEGIVPIQPDENTTPSPGTKCFVTQNGDPGAEAGLSDIDFGCTTLMSPVMDLTGAHRAFVHYNRWFGQAGNALDDRFEISVSDDGGATWIIIDTSELVDNEWKRIFLELTDTIEMTNQVVFKFVACDIGDHGIVDAAIDDFAVEIWLGVDVSNVGETPESPPVLRLEQNHPNPFNPETIISFSLPSSGPADLGIFSVDGRRITTLVKGHMEVGPHRVSWHGKDMNGREVASGTYIYRLQAGGLVVTKQMTLLK